MTITVDWDVKHQFKKNKKKNNRDLSQTTFIDCMHVSLSDVVGRVIEQRNGILFRHSVG